jgi:O-antigen ligase
VAAVILLAIGDLATSSRAGTLLGIAGAAGGYWAFRASDSRVSEIAGHRLLLGLAAAAAVFVMIAVLASHHGVASRFGQSDPVSETRVQMVAPLLRTAAAFFPFGSGLGSFATVYRQFEPNALLSTIYMNEAHNEPLQILIEGGVPALILMAVFLWWWTKTAIAVLRAELPPARRSMAIAAIVVSSLLMAQSLVDYPLRTPLLAELLALACFEMARAAAYKPRETVRETLR